MKPEHGTTGSASGIVIAISILLLLIAADARFWHVLPLGFEGALFFGGLAYWVGLLAVSITCLVALLHLDKNSRTRGEYEGVGYCLAIIAGCLVLGLLA